MTTEELQARRKQLLGEVSRLDALQMSVKILLNSAYGGLG